MDALGYRFEHRRPHDRQRAQDPLAFEPRLVRDLRARHTARKPLEQQAPLTARETQRQAVRLPVIAATYTAPPPIFQRPELAGPTPGTSGSQHRFLRGKTACFLESECKSRDYARTEWSREKGSAFQVFT